MKSGRHPNVADRSWITVTCERSMHVAVQRAWPLREMSRVAGGWLQGSPSICTGSASSAVMRALRHCASRTARDRPTCSCPRCQLPYTPHTCLHPPPPQQSARARPASTSLCRASASPESHTKKDVQDDFDDFSDFLCGWRWCYMTRLKLLHAMLFRRRESLHLLGTTSSGMQREHYVVPLCTSTDQV